MNFRIKTAEEVKAMTPAEIFAYRKEHVTWLALRVTELERALAAARAEIARMKAKGKK